MRKLSFSFLLLFVISLSGIAQTKEQLQQQNDSLKKVILALKSQEVKADTQPKAKTASTESTRCKAITQQGTQCKRNADSGSDYCWQHKAITTSTTASSSVKSTQSSSSSSATTPSGRTILTGPRGGKYYINSNGNKTYVK